MNYDTVSVIIPTYNRAQYLPDALNSIFAQSVLPYEIIVVDDGSSDDTEQVVARYGDRIRYISQENAGPSAARNRGIRAARGSIVAFLDSDDAWLPLKLEKQLKCFAEKPDLGIIGTDCFNCDEKLDNPIHQFLPKLAATERKEILIRNIWPLTSVLVRRSCFDAVGLFNEEMRFAEDWDMWIRMAQKFPASTINEPLVLMRKHQQSLSGSPATQDYNYLLWKELIIKNKKNYDMNIILFRKAMSFYNINRAYSCRINGDIHGEQLYLASSIMSWPLFAPKLIVALVRTLFY